MTDQEQTCYPHRAVVDTCVIVNVALGKKDNLPPEYLARSRKLLDDAIVQKRLELFIPTMTLIELASEHEINSRQGVSGADMRRCKKLLLDWCERCDLPAVDLTVEAVEWFRQTPEIRRLRPGDAAVLASAKYAGAEVVYTWDTGFIKAVEDANVGDSLGINVCKPPVIPEPSASQEAEYALFD